MRTIEQIEADIAACTMPWGFDAAKAELLYEELARTRDAMSVGVTCEEEEEFNRMGQTNQ